jgi:hypothetical protein
MCNEARSRKASKSQPDKAQSAASLDGLRAFATPYGGDSRRLFFSELVIRDTSVNHCLVRDFRISRSRVTSVACANI